ncbi:MAG: hypothetical protein ISS77_08540 [Phycisphaerae bacterium]|nr:hypothetical protein [Phycisphaerae bacterium]
MVAEEQIASNASGFIEALYLILAGGIGGAIVGGIMTCIEKIVIDRKLEAQRANYSKQLEGQKADYNKELEALKSQLVKKNVVHRLQFETEFQLYKEFWKKLIDVKRTARITPIVDIIPAGKQQSDIYKERWMKAAEAFNKSIDFFDYNKPFYHDDVGVPAEKLLSQYKTHLIQLEINLRRGERGNVDIYEKDEELSKMINETVVEIEVFIKTRIGLLQEAQIIE